MQRAPLYVAATNPATQRMRSAIRGAAWTLSRHRTPQKVGFLFNYTCELLAQHERRRDNAKVNLEKYLRTKHAKQTRLSYFRVPPTRERKPRRHESCAHMHTEMFFIRQRRRNFLSLFASDVSCPICVENVSEKQPLSRFPFEGEAKQEKPPLEQGKSFQSAPSDWPKQTVRFCWILFHFSLK